MFETSSLVGFCVLYLSFDLISFLGILIEALFRYEFIYDLLSDVYAPEMLTAWFPVLFLTSYIPIGLLDRTFKFGLLKLLILGPETLF